MRFANSVKVEEAGSYLALEFADVAYDSEQKIVAYDFLMRMEIPEQTARHLLDQLKAHYGEE